jgi:putative transcriptional regulator
MAERTLSRALSRDRIPPQSDGLPAARVRRCAYGANVADGAFRMESLRGQLLIAAPPLRDPNFWRTVVLVVEHSAEGALGLVLNRPAQTTVGEAIPQLSPLLDSDESVFVGGPVQPQGVMVLARFEDPSDSALIAFADVGLVGIGASEGEAELDVRAARAFVGHSGWGPGQLDAELERGDWILAPATHADAFTERPRELWSEVLMRKGGQYALLARMPPDPSVN